MPEPLLIDWPVRLATCTEAEWEITQIQRRYVTGAITLAEFEERIERALSRETPDA